MCRGVVSSEKLEMKRDEYCAISNRDLTSDTFLGGSISWRASTLPGDGLIPSLENTMPKNSLWGRRNLHFLRLNVRPHSLHRCKRFLSALSWSLMSFPSTMKPSLMCRTPFKPYMVSSIALLKMSSSLVYLILKFVPWKVVRCLLKSSNSSW